MAEFHGTQKQLTTIKTYDFENNKHRKFNL